MRSEVNPNPTIVFIPKNYKNDALNVTEMATLNGYPSISYHTDYFNTWLAQNSEIINLSLDNERFNYEIGLAQDATNYMGNQISNAMSADIGGFISDSANLVFDSYRNATNFDYSIKNQMAQIEKQSMLANKSSMGSGTTTLIGYELQNQDVFSRYTIKAQFARRLDKFFDMYGYLTNELKIPNLNSRPNWNYVKTLGVNIIADIPQEDLLQIKNYFDNGITLWHNPSTFLDYSQNNR